MSGRTLQVQGAVTEAKGRLKRRWGLVRHDRARVVEGRSEIIVGKIKRRAGGTQHALEKEIKRLRKGD